MIVATLANLLRPLGLLFALAYAGFADRLSRGAIGARILGVQIVDAQTGGRPSVRQALSRNLVPLTFAVLVSYPEWSSLLGGTLLAAALAVEALLLVAASCSDGLANLMSGTCVVATR